MDIPYRNEVVQATPLWQRYEQMLSATQRNIPRLQPVAIDDKRTMHVACYGPSLRDTWTQLGHPCISMSGATRWLADRGFIPDYHVDMDPRPNKALDVTPPVPGVTYLMASVCHPSVFDVLEAAHATIILWHVASGGEQSDLQWLEAHDNHEWLIQSGSSIGLGALQIGGFLGYRHFEIHGMDGSFANDGCRHAGAHSGKAQPNDITWDAGRVTYRTSKAMAYTVAETINILKEFPIFAVFHGDGLTQALIREANYRNTCCVDEIEKTARIRNAYAIIHYPDAVQVS